MMACHARAGTIVWIGLRPARREQMRAVPHADVGIGGLEGDHAPIGRRSVTLVQAEHLAVISALAGREASFALLRRNVAVAGLNLSTLKDRTVRLGSARLRVTGPCHPCSRMEEALGPGGYSAVRGHGGVYAEVLAPGAIALGDPLVPEGDG